MRLDLFLKVSRLVPRRTIAQKLCDANRVSVNGAKSKSSKEVKVGDVIEMRHANRTTEIRLLEIPNSKQVSKDSAAHLYEIIAEEIREADDRFAR
jgi:ribosomal 50S subunit-recycling heat shock protein